MTYVCVCNETNTAVLSSQIPEFSVFSLSLLQKKVALLLRQILPEDKGQMFAITPFNAENRQ